MPKDCGILVTMATENQTFCIIEKQAATLKLAVLFITIKNAETLIICLH